MADEEPVVTVTEESIRVDDMIFPVSNKLVVPELAEKIAHIWKRKA